MHLELPSDVLCVAIHVRTVIKDGVAQYEPEADRDMQEFVCALLGEHIGKEKIFTWN